MLAGVDTVDEDVLVAQDLESPGLGVVAAGCPAGEVQNAFEVGGNPAQTHYCRFPLGIHSGFKTSFMFHGQAS